MRKRQTASGDSPGDSRPTPSPWAGTQSPVYSVPPASYPKPWLGAQPAAIVTPGVNVTLTCRAPQPGAWRFGLFKSEEVVLVLHRDVSMELAEFFLEEVTPAQGGSYHCCYQRPGLDLGVWSHPSDTLELLVAGEVLGQEKRDTGRLPGARAPGSYSCYYHTPSAPYVLSRRSEPLLVRAHGSDSLDYTQGNLVRLALAGLVLISLGTLVFLDWRRRTPIPCHVRP
ncbi:osteoclast-associated immunoglobulin-like receptor [Suricata suricatta]|uniref:osteoclast-associated immunoglobulin-like receptor n=1 Tax=Suricata suricatta TaxID=37032 RepID=UPI0011552B22|nr:osteoclast-associated immunoglobulin-like receptor [Suricata suricatta]